MRAVAPGILRRLGFRPVMTWIGFLATALLMADAGFRPSWPDAAIYAVLIAGGFFQSLMFMAYNTIAYAEVPRPEMSAATSFYTTQQQMMLSLGIAISAAALAGSMAVRGHAAPELSDFSIAFLVVGGLAMLAPVVSLRLDPRAGEELSGHHALPTPASAPAIGAAAPAREG
jgi:hypothetical protein